jgi:hypothetical protein
MLLESLLNKRYLYGLVTGCILAIPAAWLAEPVYKSVLLSIYGDKFATLTFQCDQAMREHWIGKMALADNPSPSTISTLKATEIALLDCQDYDLLQKKLLRLGLSDSEIGELVLRAAEQTPQGLRTVIGIHEIRY